MRTRIVIALGCGIVLGLWVYGDLESIDFWGLHDIAEAAHATAAELAFVALTILVGFVVRRWWTLVALAGPLLSLDYAQIDGERGFDGGAPSPRPPVSAGLLVWPLSPAWSVAGAAQGAVAQWRGRGAASRPLEQT